MLSDQPPREQPEPARAGSDWIAPDCAGMDFYAIDQGLRDLLSLYVPKPRWTT